VLIVSAHWEAAPLMLSAPGAGTPLVYDFGGFASRYYTLTYPTPDATAFALEVASLMPDASPAHQHPSRGLDHGAWVPLKIMYPLADVPVLQLSLPTSDPFALLSLGSRLRSLRESGVLVIGSGFLTHGLPFVTQAMITDGFVPGWSSEFDQWAAEALGRGDVEALAGFRRAPGMPYAHPSADHFLPLFVTLGAATDPGKPVQTVIDGYWMGFAKRSFQVS
jgi:4,5-DOPA dioxygenase extradiol